MTENTEILMTLNKTLGERILEKLKDDILSGRYQPGDRLLYTEIASKMNVSMTPVKEALLRLEQEGIVKTIPRKGTYVTQITDRDVIEYTQLRVALELLAADLICEKKIAAGEIRELDAINKELKKALDEDRGTDSIAKDIEFHYAIVKLSKNKRLIELVQQFPLTNIQALRGAQIMVKLSRIVETHNNIIEALCNHNARLAKKLLRENIMPQMSIIDTKS
ncbi:MAG: GntR family transcriptional regulator [Spirochaetales bacterium]|jgi:DNA-binding GntR family transcriptional regulator|nr:GntR family transcriptional regulator [Spirochaetales bacterium]